MPLQWPLQRTNTPSDNAGPRDKLHWCNIFNFSLPFCFYFLDLPDVMPEVREACSLILFLFHHPSTKKVQCSQKCPHNTVRYKTTFYQWNIVWGNSFSTVIKKTTTTSKWHFSCGYEINDPIQTNLPSWSWVLTKALTSPQKSLQRLIQ